MKSLLFLISLPAAAYCINAGGPTIFIDNTVAVKCFTDAQFAAGGTAFTDPGMGPGELATLRYCVTCGFTIPAAPGFYQVTLDFVEPPRSLLTGPGQRVFTVTVNGAQTPDIDLWKLTGGAGRLYTVKVLAISAGVVRIDLKTRVRNALVNRITVEPASLIDAFGSDIKPLIENEWRKFVPLANCVSMNMGGEYLVVIYSFTPICADGREWSVRVAAGVEVQ